MRRYLPTPKTQDTDLRTHQLCNTRIRPHCLAAPKFPIHVDCGCDDADGSDSDDEYSLEEARVAARLTNPLDDKRCNRGVQDLSTDLS